MIPELPIFISIIFIIITIVSIGWFYKATKSKAVLGMSIIWTLIVSVLSLSGFLYEITQVPPRVVLFIVPVFVSIIVFTLSSKSNVFIEKINFETLTYFSIIRIPVEIVLALLFHHGAMSVLQTFEGANFDIISGITAPIIAFLYFRQKKLGNNAFLAWNIICLLLLITIIVISSLALEGPLQKIAFDQPNIAIMFFPFALLPTIVVPLVFFAHILSIKKLIKTKSSEII